MVVAVASVVVSFPQFNGAQVNCKLASETIESNESSKYTHKSIQWHGKSEKKKPVSAILFIYICFFNVFSLISRPLLERSEPREL